MKLSEIYHSYVSKLKKTREERRERKRAPFDRCRTVLDENLEEDTADERWKFKHKT